MSLDHVFKAHDSDAVSKNDPFLKNTKGSIMIISGKKRSGKSTLWLSMLGEKKIFKGYFGNIFLISPSQEDKTTGLRKELDQDGKYYKELNEPNIKAILDYIKQEQQAQKIKEQKLKKKLPPIYNCLILDDVVADLPRTFKKNIITSLFLNHRHYNMTIFCITQSYKSIAPTLRKQADLLYLFPTANLKEKEALQEDWDIPDEIFEEAFDDESDHPFLTVNLVGSKPVYFRKMNKI
jgi:ABC-type dipeptide/oligopeptide/nickel transport system ATPase subunit